VFILPLKFRLLTGSIVKLQRKGDSFVIKVNETEIAIEKEIASGIYVKEA
jgi:Fe2+ transport system protein FeoA